MITKTVDFAPYFNPEGRYVLDVSGWDYVSIQPIGGGLTLAGTNDGGEITGQQESSPIAADNFVAIDAVDQTTGAAASTIAAGAIGRVTVGCKYIELDGTTVTKLMVVFQKVY